MLDELDECVLRELLRIYSSLASSQVEMDLDFKEILYENLWDLYLESDNNEAL